MNCPRRASQDIVTVLTASDWHLQGIEYSIACAECTERILIKTSETSTNYNLCRRPIDRHNTNRSQKQKTFSMKKRKTSNKNDEELK